MGLFAMNEGGGGIRPMDGQEVTITKMWFEVRKLSGGIEKPALMVDYEWEGKPSEWYPEDFSIGAAEIVNEFECTNLSKGSKAGQFMHSFNEMWIVAGLEEPEDDATLKDYFPMKVNLMQIVKKDLQGDIVKNKNDHDKTESRISKVLGRVAGKSNKKDSNTKPANGLPKDLEIVVKSIVSDGAKTIPEVAKGMREYNEINGTEFVIKSAYATYIKANMLPKK